MPSRRVRAFAKINLCLEVLNRRPDGFHNLRTIFQTISLADTIHIDAEQARRTQVDVASNVEIPGENLVFRAAHSVLEAIGRSARVRLVLEKKIPMGGGLGGGSTDAAAVLLAIPAMLGRPVPRERLMELGAGIGSDVPFFLIGGTAVGLGRGTELYPLPDATAVPVLVVAPAVHVSTAEAYSVLARGVEPAEAGCVSATERAALAIACGRPVDEWRCLNDFEDAVLKRHSEIATARRRLQRAGAKAAMMTGSGASVFGLFASKQDRDSAASLFEAAKCFRASFVSRARFRAAWRTVLS
jgi:4-diphosphocytidyl-2-C-methyl-D-erythritol kinase